MSKNTICITGGTAGHVLPAIVLQKYYDGDLLIEDSATKFIIGDNTYSTFRYSSIYNIWHFIKCFFWSLFNLGKYETIILFGCYVSLPFIIAARLLSIFTKKKLLVHEQNAILGRANKVAIFFGFTLLSTFYIKNCKRQNYFGLPVFSAIKKKTHTFKYAVVYAGSLGSDFFDKNVVPLVNKYAIKYDLNFIIQVKDTSKFTDYNMRLQFVNYLEIKDNINDITANAEFIISRAGANAIGSFTLYQKKALLIPLKNSKDNHQYYNALYSGFSLIEEKDFNEENFFLAIEHLIIGNIKLFIVEQ